MLKYLTENESMLILAYPKEQKVEVDHFLSPVEFKNPIELVGTYCTELTIVDENDVETKVRECKTPHLIQEVELIKRSSDEEPYFLEVEEKHRDFLDSSKVVQILNLYCAFDDAICAYPETDLIVAERIATKA